MKRRTVSILLMLVLTSAACDDDFEPLGVYPGSLAINAVSIDTAEPGQQAFSVRVLEVRVTHANTRDAASGVVVNWRIVSGSHAVLEATTSVTDATGISRSRVRLYAAGEYVIEASFPGLRGRPARFVFQATAP